ncbi:hypothetical protein JW926_06015 [Candidatus Sumerlaeota bacterium]|nr:hypothetical protein [Candidatus Sumerlaeota bacterium]
MKNYLIRGMTLGFLIMSCHPGFAGLLEGFNYDTDGEAQTDWVVTLYSGAGSGNVYAEKTNKTEGVSSLKAVYDYTGQTYYTMTMTKTLSTPIDLSSIKRFRISIYGDTANKDKLTWYIRFYSTTGHTIRFLDMDRLGDTGWRDVDFDLVDLTSDYWVSGYWGHYGDNPDITSINKIELILEQTNLATAPGTSTVYFDNLQMFDDSNQIIFEAIDNFNYATEGELESVWTTKTPTPPPTGFAIDIATTTALKIEGTAAMQYDYAIVDYWRNIWCEREIPAARDFSDIAFFRIWIYGDPAISDKSPLMLFAVQDTNNNRVYANMRTALKTGKWSCYHLSFIVDDPGTGSLDGPFRQDQYDNGGDFVIESVYKFGLNIQGSTQYESYSSTCVIDKMELGYRGFVPEPQTSTFEPWALYE